MVSNTINWVLGNTNLNPEGHQFPKDIRTHITKIRALPPLPGTAVKILNLIADPRADAHALAEIIEADPIIAAQLVRWASSPLYGYKGKVSSVHDAITRVLGFNFVLDLALGLSVIAPLKAPIEGSIGTRMFWIHALASTRLMLQLKALMSNSISINHNEVFLVALLHNIGFPVFGHQFPDEFKYLSDLIAANPDHSINILETAAFGISHTEIGAWLLTAWSIPSVLSEIVANHHDCNYRGQNYQLNLLTYVNDYLLGQLGIGDVVADTCPDEVWLTLGIDQDDATQVLEKFKDEITHIKATAAQITG